MFNAPRDANVQVHRETPEGLSLLTPLRIPFPNSKLPYQEGWVLRTLQHWYYCPQCEGWINGIPTQHRVNNLDSHRRAGRKGVEFYCIRCGQRIHFEGLVS